MPFLAQMMTMYMTDCDVKVAAITLALDAISVGVDRDSSPSPRKSRSRESSAEPPSPARSPRSPRGGSESREDEANPSSPVKLKVMAELSALEGLSHQFKGGSATVGTPHVTDACVAFREALVRQDSEGAQAAAVGIVDAFIEVRQVFTQLLQLEGDLAQTQCK